MCEVSCVPPNRSITSCLYGSAQRAAESPTAPYGRGTRSIEYFYISYVACCGFLAQRTDDPWKLCFVCCQFRHGLHRLNIPQIEAPSGCIHIPIPLFEFLFVHLGANELLMALVASFGSPITGDVTVQHRSLCPGICSKRVSRKPINRFLFPSYSSNNITRRASTAMSAGEFHIYQSEVQIGCCPFLDHPSLFHLLIVLNTYRTYRRQGDR